MLSLIALLALCLFAVNGNPMDADFDPDEDCVSIKWNRMHFEGCSSTEINTDGGNGDQIPVDDVYSIANETCRNQDKTIKCMAQAVKPCRNFRELMNIAEASLGFCDKGNVAPVMADFFKSNLGASFDGTCFAAVRGEIRKRFGRPRLPKSYPTTLTEKLEERMSLFDWYVERFLSMDLNGTIDACNGMTRQTVYGFMFALVSISLGWGANLYPEFVSIVQPSPNPWGVK